MRLTSFGSLHLAPKPARSVAATRCTSCSSTCWGNRSCTMQRVGMDTRALNQGYRVFIPEKHTATPSMLLSWGGGDADQVLIPPNRAGAHFHQTSLTPGSHPDVRTGCGIQSSLC